MEGRIRAAERNDVQGACRRYATCILDRLTHGYPAKEKAMLNSGQLQELLIQSLEHERGGVLVYEIAVRCASDDDCARNGRDI